MAAGNQAVKPGRLCTKKRNSGFNRHGGILVPDNQILGRIRIRRSRGCGLKSQISDKKRTTVQPTAAAQRNTRKKQACTKGDSLLSARA